MTRPWPPYLSPGWLTAYVVGLSLWALVAGFCGLAIVGALLWFGFAACCAAARGMGADR